MIRAKLLYAVLLVISILFFVLYRGKLSFELLIFAVLFPLPLWFSVVMLKRGMKTELYHSKEPIMKGRFFQWIVQIDNRSIFSCAHAQMTFEYRSSLTDTTRELTMIVPVMGRNSQRLRLTFHTVTCGVMQLTLKKIVIFDGMRLFKRTLRFEKQDTVIVMPEPTVMIPTEWPPVPQPDADTAEYSKTKSGDDPSEIFDLHLYREGDLISRIHWKLSSKLDTLMVKEYSLPVSAGCLLMADYRHLDESPVSALRVDSMLSAMFAAAAELHARGGGFAVSAYHADHGITASELFTSLPDAVEWLRHMVITPPVSPKERGTLMTAMKDFLSDAHPFERILLFTPQLDDPLTELLISTPNPERITVFAVITPKDSVLPESFGQPFACVPIMLPQPEHPSLEELRHAEEPDYDTEILVQGGALP